MVCMSKIWLSWNVLACNGLYCAVHMVQVIQVVRVVSLDDMHSGNIWFSWYKPSKYREKLICHACDGGRTDGRRKVENRAVFWIESEIAKETFPRKDPHVVQSFCLLYVESERLRWVRTAADTILSSWQEISEHYRWHAFEYQEIPKTMSHVSDLLWA